jgi:hypothetical protein
MHGKHFSILNESHTSYTASVMIDSLYTNKNNKIRTQKNKKKQEIDLTT